MPDADEFLDEYQNGGTLILGYDKANDNVNLYVYTVESNDGRMFVTFEKSDTLQREMFRQCKAIPKPITTLMIFPPIVMLLFVAAGFYVGRHVESSAQRRCISFTKTAILIGQTQRKSQARKRGKNENNFIGSPHITNKTPITNPAVPKMHSGVYIFISWIYLNGHAVSFTQPTSQPHPPSDLSDGRCLSLGCRRRPDCRKRRNTRGIRRRLYIRSARGGCCGTARIFAVEHSVIAAVN